MANRKKYVAKLIREEKLRRQRLRKKMIRKKKLAGLKKDMMNKAGSMTAPTGQFTMPQG